MHLTLSSVVLVIGMSQVLATPAPRMQALEARDTAAVFSKRIPQGGSASSGNAGSVDGGSIVLNAGADGTIVNTGNSCKFCACEHSICILINIPSAIAGKGGNSSSGAAIGGDGYFYGGDASSGDAGSALGGNLSLTAESIANSNGSAIAGNGGISVSGDATAGDATGDENAFSNNFQGFSNSDVSSDSGFSGYIPFTGFN
jgi:hypothetical protein